LRPRFHRRYRELHRTPPILGFLCSISDDPDGATAGFVATATFCSPDADLGETSVIGVPHTLYIWRHLVLNGGLVG
jgi:hypothetical protein